MSDDSALASRSRHDKNAIQAASQRDPARFTFEQNWFELVREDWERLTALIRDGRRLRVLEIGSFEGASTTWMLDNLLDHSESSMVAVDTFQGGMEHQAEDRGSSTDQTAADGVNYDLHSLEARFLRNVKQCQNFHKLRVLKANSQDALITLIQETAVFDFIYIDGSHVALDVLHDAVLSWRMLSVGGTIVFDDYSWRGYLEHLYNPRIAIQAFLQCAENEADVIETESQMWVTKVPTKIRPTSNPDESLFYWNKPSWHMAPGLTKE